MARASKSRNPDGNRFLDFMSGIAVLSTGHANPRVVKAVQEAAEKFLHISSDFYHEGWVRLSEKLDEIRTLRGRRQNLPDQFRN